MEALPFGQFLMYHFITEINSLFFFNQGKVSDLCLFYKCMCLYQLSDKRWTK